MGTRASSRCSLRQFAHPAQLHAWHAPGATVTCSAGVPCSPCTKCGLRCPACAGAARRRGGWTELRGRSRYRGHPGPGPPWKQGPPQEEGSRTVGGRGGAAWAVGIGARGRVYEPVGPGRSAVSEQPWTRRLASACMAPSAVYGPPGYPACCAVGEFLLVKTPRSPPGSQVRHL